MLTQLEDEECLITVYAYVLASGDDLPQFEGAVNETLTSF